MPNPIISQMNGLNNVREINNVRQLGEIMRSGNPYTALNAMLSHNPKYKEMRTILRKYNNNPKAAFYGLANEMNVNPDNILNALKGE